MAKLLDPVCGMTVDENALRAPGYDDVAFCAPGCRTAFLDDPDAYQDRLDGAEPMPKKCTCGKQEDGICRCGSDHDDHGHEGHSHEAHSHEDHGHEGHSHAVHNREEHGHECHRNADQTEDSPEPVASGSGCCGGHGG